MEKNKHFCKKKIVCKIKEKNGGFKIECDTEKGRKKMVCFLGQKGKTGGLSALGFGAQYGSQKPTFECVTEDEMKEKVAKELKDDLKREVKKEEIKWIEEE